MHQRHWKSSYMSPSRIDNYIYHRDNESSTVEHFIVQLLRLEPMSRNVLAGIAGHAYIERLLVGEMENNFSINGWQFSINPKLDITIALPLDREKWCSKDFGEIQILGKTDAIGADIIHDYKFTSKINIEKYMQSWQWQVYLWMTGLSKFVYNIFEIDIDDDSDKATITDYQELKIYRYNGLDERVCGILAEYSNYLDLIKPHIDKMKGE